LVDDVAVGHDRTVIDGIAAHNAGIVYQNAHGPEGRFRFGDHTVPIVEAGHSMAGETRRRSEFGVQA
jgi:hypothetical protein